MRPIAAALLAALLPLGAWAQSLKPGLWEITTRMQGGGGERLAAAQAQMQEQMKNMPPEQRKMVEEMMSRQGVRMAPSGGGGGMNLQICMTREMAERSEVPVGRGDCKVTSQQRTGSTMKSSFSCTNPPSSGEAQVTFSGPEAYTSKVLVNSTAGGKAETTQVESAGRWLSADCGSVKPPARR